MGDELADDVFICVADRGWLLSRFDAELWSGDWLIAARAMLGSVLAADEEVTLSSPCLAALAGSSGDVLFQLNLRAMPG